MMRNVRAFLSVSALLAVACAGCSEKAEYAPVAGKVLFKGRPLTSGVIMFQPPQGPPSRGTIQPDGSFELTTIGGDTGARVGTNQVRVSCREAPPGGDKEVGLGRLLIPQRYTEFASSGLTAEVKRSDNEPFIFQLTD